MKIDTILFTNPLQIVWAAELIHYVAQLLKIHLYPHLFSQFCTVGVSTPLVIVIHVKIVQWHADCFYTEDVEFTLSLL